MQEDVGAVGQQKKLRQDWNSTLPEVIVLPHTEYIDR